MLFSLYRLNPTSDGVFSLPITSKPEAVQRTQILYVSKLQIFNFQFRVDNVIIHGFIGKNLFFANMPI